MRLSVLATLLLPLALASPLANPIATAQGASSSLAPLSATGEHIEDAYIVVFKKGVDINQIALHLSGVEQWHGSDVSVSVQSYTLKGPCLSSSGASPRRQLLVTSVRGPMGSG